MSKKREIEELEGGITVERRRHKRRPRTVCVISAVTSPDGEMLATVSVQASWSRGIPGPIMSKLIEDSLTGISERVSRKMRQHPKDLGWDSVEEMDAEITANALDIVMGVADGTIEVVP